MLRLPSLTTGDQPGADRHQRAAVAVLQSSKVAELLDGYRAGASVKDLAARFGIHRATVTHHLHRNRVSVRQRGLDDHQIDHAVHLHQDGLSLVEVGAHLNVHAETIRQALRARGIQMRAPWERPHSILGQRLTPRNSPQAVPNIEVVIGADLRPGPTTGAVVLPLDDDSVDTVLATLTLCTVGDLPAAVAEIRRVLRPGGQVLVLEHVRSLDPQLARWQDRLHRPWRWCGAGCTPNRDTAAAFTTAGFDTTALTRFTVPGMPLTREWVTGRLT